MREGGRVWVGVCECDHDPFNVFGWECANGMGSVFDHDPFNVYVLCAVHPSRVCTHYVGRLALFIVAVHWHCPYKGILVHPSHTHVHTHAAYPPSPPIPVFPRSSLRCRPSPHTFAAQEFLAGYINVPAIMSEDGMKNFIVQVMFRHGDLQLDVAI